MRAVEARQHGSSGPRRNGYDRLRMIPEAHCCCIEGDERLHLRRATPVPQLARFNHLRHRESGISEFPARV